MREVAFFKISIFWFPIYKKGKGSQEMQASWEHSQPPNELLKVVKGEKKGKARVTVRVWINVCLRFFILTGWTWCKWELDCTSPLRVLIPLQARNKQSPCPQTWLFLPDPAPRTAMRFCCDSGAM